MQSIMKAIRSCALVASLVLAPILFANVPDDPKFTPLAPLPIHAGTTLNIVDALASRHYISTTLDDRLSERIYDAYLEDLDPSRSYLLASDLAEFAQYRTTLDNTLQQGDVSAAFIIFNRYNQRLIDRSENVVAMIDKGIDQFDFTIDESLPVERKDEPWASSMEQLDDLWRKRIKNATLSLILAEKEPEKIQETLSKRYKSRLASAYQYNSEDVFQLFMNSFTRSYDPHTSYFSPTTSENFNINMSLSLEGIGAVLQREDEFTKVVSVVPAGPADKSKQLFPNDKIVAVGQGMDGEMVDVVGWRLDEVVQLIRGKKDTIVRLDIIPASSKDVSGSKTINITRNTVKLEEQSAKSEIIEVQQFGATHKIGVINIPTFYIDFQAFQQGDKDFKSTTRDVRKLLADLVKEGVEGVVIDLRDNGGGSLQEAKTLTGLFIDRGPTVQIRNKINQVEILRDHDFHTAYEGPLAVIVNRLSASASEIFAGAIQDYQRGLIIGSQTFGKGTVQSLLPLNRGQLKLTQAKFYRITGESTQHKGIIPDILYPSAYDPEQIGESTLEGPLAWDKIDATDYRPRSPIAFMVPELRHMHDERVDHDPEFSYLRASIQYRQQLANEKFISLNKATRLKEKADDTAFWLALENKKRDGLGLAQINSLDDLKEPEAPTLADNAPPATGITAASGSGEGTTDGLTGSEVAGVIDGAADDGEETIDKPKEPDAYRVEASNILLDLISLTHRTAAKVAADSRI